jgi:CHAT domain-containing protein/tetratricopeptide (TPR) repeat protein
MNQPHNQSLSEPPSQAYPYQVGGSLKLNAPTYVSRQADQDLYDLLQVGELCYVLNSRQMGKSSLRVRTMARLQGEGVVCVAIQLTDIIEEGMTPEQWYAGVINSIATDLQLYEQPWDWQGERTASQANPAIDRFDDGRWWLQYSHLSSVQRFSKFVEEVLLVLVPGQIVIFIDELDRILSLPFNVDGFFAVIRECYNKRADIPIYNRLTFVLIGVATPTDLIQDERSTPFNVGRSVELHGFKLHEVEPLVAGLAGKVANGMVLLREILAWTGGQPFLTQKLCQLVQSLGERIAVGEEAAVVEELVQSQILTNWEAQDVPEHLRTIRDLLLRDEQRTGRLLGLYQRFLSGDTWVTEASLELLELQLSGLVILRQGQLWIYNQIYQEVFDRDWIERTLANLRPYAAAITVWLASEQQDESVLLRGQTLQNAQAWAKARSLNDDDYQFLAASEALEKHNVQLALDAEKQANQILAEANRQVLRKSKIGLMILVISLIGTAISLGFVHRVNKNLAVAKVNLNQTEQERKQLEVEKETLESSKSDLEQEKSQLQVSVEQSQQQLIETRNQVETVQKLQVQAEASRQILEQEKVQLQVSVEQSQRQLVNTQNEVETARNLQVQAERSRQISEQKLQEVNEDLNNVKITLNRTIENANIQIADLELEMQEVSQNLLLERQETERAIAATEAARQELIQIQDQFELTNLALLETYDEVDQLSIEVESISDQSLIQSRVRHTHQRLQVIITDLGLRQLPPTIDSEVSTESSVQSQLIEQGNSAYLMGALPDALESYEKALEISRDQTDSLTESISLGNLGGVYTILGDYEKAIELYAESLVITQERGDRKGEGSSLSNLGLVYQNLGQYQIALNFHRLALVIAQEIGDLRTEGITLGNLGYTYQSLGQYQQAIEFHMRSLAIAREIRDRQGEVINLGNLGLAYQSLGQYTRAINLHKQALVIAGEIGDLRTEGATLGNLGYTYQNLGQYQYAIDFHEQSLVIAREIGDRQREAISLDNLGFIYQKLQQYQYAIDFHEQSLVIAREIGDRQREAISLDNLGLIYQESQQYQKAINFHEQSLIIAQEIGYLVGQESTLHNMGASFFAIGQLPEAIESLWKAITVHESIRSDLISIDRLRFFYTQTKSYELLQQALIAQNKIHQALEVAEKRRSRIFDEVIIRDFSARDADLISASIPTWKELQNIIQRQNATLVEYSIIETTVGKPALYIWVIQPSGQLHFRQVDLSAQTLYIYDLVAQARKAMGVRHHSSSEVVPSELSPTKNLKASFERLPVETSPTKKLQQLYQLLIEPIADLLPTDPEAQVIFSPQGELFLVPFPALIDCSGQYLIETHTILTTPSIQLLDTTWQQRTSMSHTSQLQRRDLTIVGNPALPSVWSPVNGMEVPQNKLPGAKREALAIASLFNTEPLIGAQATETTVKQQMQQARIIHLAAEGLLEHGHPEDFGVQGVPGAIALTPTAMDDGLLTTTEILDLDLNAELVVLSGSNTGLGRISNDGIQGLSQSLIIAGASSIIVSLWSVPDAPTAQLMIEFYQNWQEQGMNKAQALRQAMLTTRRQHPSPRNWATFTLIGQPD